MWFLWAAWLACSTPTPPAVEWRPVLEAWRHPDPLPALPFFDGEQVRTLQDLQGRWNLVAFVFTRCGNAEACPLTMQRLAALQPELSDVQLVVFTLDPEHDDPERLRAYAVAHGLEVDGVVFGTLPPGAEPALLRDGVPSLFNVVALGQGPSTSHPTRVTLIDPEGREAAAWEASEVSAEGVRAAVAGNPATVRPPTPRKGTANQIFQGWTVRD